LQELASSRPVLLRSKGVVVGDRWKGADSQLRGRAESPLRVEQLSWQEDQKEVSTKLLTDNVSS
jgi:hypothetical protein